MQRWRWGVHMVYMGPCLAGLIEIVFIGIASASRGARLEASTVNAS